MNFKHLFILLFLISLVTNSKGQTNMKQATFGAGCFWCVEAIFQDVKGVESVESGYSGGHIDNPTYEQVCSKKTGHAEVIRINYDESVVDFNTLLEVFWHTHNPTTLNRQGADVGPQYRSVIYFHDDEQKEKALASRKNTAASGLWNDPIVTEISPLINYYVAEKYHQDYYKQNPNQGYCSVVIAPKVAKFRKQFKHLLKEAH
jgi:peptide-methionine (S)-S-oxide reductase